MNKTTKTIQDELKNRISILENDKLLYNLLVECIISSETMTSNHKAKAKQLVSANGCGVIEKLLISPNRDIFLKERLIGDIINNTGYNRDVADWIFDTWYNCIDQEVIDLWIEHKNMIKDDIIENIEDKKEDNIKKLLLPNGVLIPCGVGNDDNGFFACGIKEADKFLGIQESIYAVIFNYLQRNTNIDEKIDKPIFIKEYETQLHYAIDYRNIYRLMILMLLMIKNNYLKDDVLAFEYDGNFDEVKIAFLTINNYIKLLSKLIGVKDYKIMKYQKDPKLQLSLSNNHNSGIHIVPNKNEKLKDRIIWFAPKINYKICEYNKEDLEYFLKEISDFRYFKEGQFHALQQMLNAKTHKICIMPTGSGKSLIFYLNTLLQPGVTFVIAPTELLISDQIENLKRYHRIDDSKALRYGENFVNLKLINKIYYLTPETFQNRDLLREFIEFNSTKKISNIVLDEVHCISNWSHDFRPEYLMLSTYLNRYLDRIYFLCFTATANYSVIKDIKNELNIKRDEDIISPIKLEKDNISFNFIACDDFEQMAKYSFAYLKKGLIRGQKTLVFTKTEKISDLLVEQLDEIKYEVEIYRESDKSAYRAFAEGRCKILIASEEIGIGINLSNVQNILHFGLPISKGEYVQEIGRAGRSSDSSSSLVVYMKCNNNHVDEHLLQRTTGTSEIIEIVNTYKERNQYNDYIDVYKRILGDIDSQYTFNTLIHTIFDRIKNINESEEVDFEYKNIDKTKRALYMLFAIGYINNWSICNIDCENNKATILIGINKENLGLERIKENTKKHLYLLGNDKKSILSVGRAKTIKEIIDIYNDWHYNHFIYHHKEQFLDMLSFFETYKLDDRKLDYNLEINKRLVSYFSLSMLDISQDQAKYVNLSFKHITDIISSGVEYSTVSNIQRINQDDNNIKLDYFLFIYSIIADNEYDKERIKRILSNMSDEIYFDFIEAISILYEKLTIKDRFQLFKDMNVYIASDTNKSFNTFFDMIFRTNKKDIIYYGVLSKEINSKIRGAYNV